MHEREKVIISPFQQWTWWKNFGAISSNVLLSSKDKIKSLAKIIKCCKLQKYFNKTVITSYHPFVEKTFSTKNLLKCHIFWNNSWNLTKHLMNCIKRISFLFFFHKKIMSIIVDIITLNINLEYLTKNTQVQSLKVLKITCSSICIVFVWT